MNPADRDQASLEFRSPGNANDGVPVHVAPHQHLLATQSVVSLVPPWIMVLMLPLYKHQAGERGSQQGPATTRQCQQDDSSEQQHVALASIR